METPRFADNSGSRLLMAFIAGWLAVVFTLAASFHVGTEHRTDQLMMRLAQVAVCYGFCSGLALFVCRLLMRRCWSDALGYTLIAGMTVAGVGMAVNLAGYCSFPGTWEAPFFGSATDFAKEWQNVAWHQSTGGYIPGSNIGYTALASLAAGRLGPGISGILIMNILMLCGTVACTAQICSELLPGHNPRKTALAGAIAVSLVASLIWYATTPLKESAATFAFTLFALAIAQLYRRRLGVSGITAAAAGAFLLLPVKAPLAWFAIAGVLLALTRIKLADRHKATSTLMRGLYLLIIAGAVVVGGRHFRAIPDAVLGSIGAGEEVPYSEYMYNYDTVQRYNTLIPGYFHATPLERLEKLPLAAAAQYFPPFPWNYMRDRDEGRFVWYAHIPWGWYLLGGAALGYAVLCAGRRRRSASLGRWALWWAVCYLGVALFSGGTVARYYLPFIPCIVPLSLQFALCVRRGLVTRRAAAIYGATYALLLAGGLTAAYIFLKL